MALRVLREALSPGDTGHILDHEQIHKRLSEQGRVLCPYADEGADPTGATDVTAAFADMNTWLMSKGGGSILLPPQSIFKANLSLGYAVNLVGCGKYSSVIKGVAGAAKPVVALDSYGNIARDFGIVGTLPYDGTTGSDADPEYGLTTTRLLGQWGEPRVVNVDITLTRGCGYVPQTPGGYVRNLTTIHTGGYGIYHSVGCTDSSYSDCQVGPVLGGGGGIYAAGLDTLWSNCESYAQGLYWTGSAWQFDGLNDTWHDSGNALKIGWVIGFQQKFSGCRTEDNPIGLWWNGGDSNFDGVSAGDRIVAHFESLDQTWINNALDIQVYPNDRFVPRTIAELVYFWKSRIKVQIDWENTSIAGTPESELSWTQRNRPNFKVFDDQSPGPSAPYTNNEFEVHGDKNGGAFHNASAGALTPDIADGTVYYLNCDANATVNAFVDRYALRPGQKLRFLCNPGLSSTTTVTWDASYGSSADTLAAGKTTLIEYTNISTTFSPVWARTLLVAR